MTSQIASGEENDLKIRAWGDKGGIEWKTFQIQILYY